VMGVAQDSWKENGSRYRCWLMEDGRQVEEDAKTKANHVKIRKGIPAEIVDESLKNKGELGVGVCLLIRIKCLTAGVAIGSKSFVESLYARHREAFGEKRKRGAKPVGDAENRIFLADIYSLQGKAYAGDCCVGERSMKKSPQRE